MTPARRVIPSVPLGAEGARGIRRADITIEGIDQNGPSHELRVFLDNPDADAETEPVPDNGYAGSVYVYGHGGGLDDLEGSDVHIPVPMTRTIIATDAVRRARDRGPTASVTLVPVSYDTPAPDIDLDSVDVAVLIDEEPGA